ncbi:MAG: type II toxin-antitoxin system VapB family antitoxin [Chloroflexota bacterium]|nr:type II toxin-antitoxin system VapB family antitoxin [Chloroflexota bacterium]
MTMSIKLPQTRRLIDELAVRGDELPNPALSDAVKERIDRPREEVQSKKLGDLRAILDDLTPRLQDAPNSWDIDALLYDDRGLPRTG